MQFEAAVAATLLGLVGCGKSEKVDVDTPPGPLTVASIACIDEQVGLTTSNVRSCEQRLAGFLEKNPDLRIAAIFGIDQAVANAQESVRENGTREIVVMHSTSGPWPTARALTVDAALLCAAPRGAQTTPKACLDEIGKWSPEIVGNVAFWIPLNSWHDESLSTAGTKYILTVSRRTTTTPGSAPRGAGPESGP